jgi:hypothetical protein
MRVFSDLSTITDLVFAAYVEKPTMASNGKLRSTPRQKPFLRPSPPWVERGAGFT